MNTKTKVKYIHVDLFLQYLTKQGYFTILAEGMTYAYMRISNKELEAEINIVVTSTRFYNYIFIINSLKLEIYLLEVAEHVKALNESNHTCISLIKSSEVVYKAERKKPFNEYEFQRDILEPCRTSQLFNSVETER